MVNEMVRISHNDYSKISDYVFYLDKNWSMKFFVELNSYDDKGKHNFHTEYGYNSKNGYEVSIIRNFRYYLCIESNKRDSNGYKYQLRIFQNDMYFLLHKLQIVEQWFIGNQDVFAKKDGKIIIPSRQYSEKVELQFGHWLMFEPTVFIFNNQDVIGVRVYLDSDSLSACLPVDRLFGLLYFLRNFNMYQSAQLMINYLGMNKYGINYNHFYNQKKRYDESGLLDNNTKYVQKEGKTFLQSINARERTE